ncbi:MAG: DEAD/DEAH box helicase family protein, partial [Planctomycetes bacterium]|nr:DEAD/DEAH box helicase family protein [Planctomycetota bacterium]
LRLSSYDRLFPNQDTMPRGGFGNLIALPLQHEARKAGHTLFADDRLVPIPDQWGFLAAQPRIAASRVYELVRQATERGQVIGTCVVDAGSEDDREPWRLPVAHTDRFPRIECQLPGSVRAVIAQQLFVEKAGLPSPLLNQIKRLATFSNPEFYKKQAMRLSTATTPRLIGCAEETSVHIGLPRGCRQALEDLLRHYGVELAVEDKRQDGTELVAEFRGELVPEQQAAARALLEQEIGVFVAPPGSGKTVVGAYVIAARKRSTLVLVHRSQLLDQWRNQLAAFLGLDLRHVGQIGGGKRKVTGSLDVAMLQSLVRRDEVDPIVANYGHVVVDECHHVSAVSFERVMRSVYARFVTGLTATPRRRDGHHPILEFQLGPVRHAIDSKRRAARPLFEHRLIVRETSFRLEDRPTMPPIQEIYRLLAEDESRNRMIIDDVLQALEEKRSPIVLTERRDHLEFLVEEIQGAARNLIVLRGGMGLRQRRELRAQLAAIPPDEERLLIATGKFIGEGFDDARLDTLFLTMPVSWKGTLVQYAGRLHRALAGKNEVRVFDYVDRQVPMLARMFVRREAGYRSMGYESSEPSSAQNEHRRLMVEYDDLTDTHAGDGNWDVDHVQ